jgi:hypothetical protein
MLKRRRGPTLAGLVAVLAIVAGCSGAGATTSSAERAATGTAGTGASASPATATMIDSHEDAADYAWDASSEVAISLRDGGSSGGDGVVVDGDVVTLTESGTYRLSGSLTDGQVLVDTAADGLVRLVLDGVAISNATTAPISVVDAEKVVVILAANSENTLSDATSYVFASADVDEPNAALFSTADLTIAGEGSLTVEGNFNDGIASKDGLIIAGGTITVTAADDGVRGKDYLIFSGGNLTATAGGDALKADNAEDAGLGTVSVAGGSVDLGAGTDGIDATGTATVRGGTLTIAAGDDAIHADVRLEVLGGSIDVSRSYEGLEATQIAISGGTIAIVAEDDGLNVAGGNDGSAQNGPGDRAGGGPPGGGGGETATEGYYVTVSGGTLLIDAGGDGFDSNGSAEITGGTIVVNGPTSNGNGALDVNGEFLISGGVLVAAGSAGMAETPSASSPQATLALNFNAAQAAGTVVRIQAPDGSAVTTFAAAKPFQSLVVSVPELSAGTAYDVLTGGTVSGESLGGLYLDPDYSGGASVGTVSTATR